MKRLGVFFAVILLLIVAGMYFITLNSSSNLKNQSLTPTPMEKTSPTPSKNQIIFPKGGEKLIKGQQYMLKWTAQEGTIQIFLIDSSLESQGQSVSIVDRVYGVQNTGSYSYTVPQDIPNGTYKLQIGTSTSNEFKIQSNEEKQQ